MDEEERWLDALEKGELDDNGELKKEIDESLLTARQVRKRDGQGMSMNITFLLIQKKSVFSHLCFLESPVT